MKMVNIFLLSFSIFSINAIAHGVHPKEFSCIDLQEKLEIEEQIIVRRGRFSHKRVYSADFVKSVQDRGRNVCFVVRGESLKVNVTKSKDKKKCEYGFYCRKGRSTFPNF